MVCFDGVFLASRITMKVIVGPILGDEAGLAKPTVFLEVRMVSNVTCSLMAVNVFLVIIESIT